MEHTVYNDGYDVLQSDLQNTESTKIDAIKSRTTDYFGKAIVSGGVISDVGSAKIDITACDGYDGNGEKIVAPLLSGQSIPAGHNWIKLSYLEVLSDQRAHPVTGTLNYTRATDSYTLTIDDTTPDTLLDVVLGEVTNTSGVLTIDLTNRTPGPEILQHHHTGSDGTPQLDASAALVDGSIIAIKIQDAAVTSSKINDNAVISSKIQDGAVTYDELATGAVYGDKIANQAIKSAKLDVADGTTGQDTNSGSGVKTNHVQDAAITQTKIADSAIVEAKLNDGSVTVNKLADDAVESKKLKVADGTSGQDTSTGSGVKTNHIQDDAITNSKIADESVTTVKTNWQLTTVEREALTPSNGMIVYDTDINRMYMYENGAWIRMGSFRTQVFTTSGTWVKPSNTTWVQFTAIGAGGGGGGGLDAGRGVTWAGGGGGAGKIKQGVLGVSGNLTITIGSGGSVGGGSGGDGGNGGATSVGTVSCAGGNGGKGGVADINGGSGGSGGGGGGHSNATGVHSQGAGGGAGGDGATGSGPSGGTGGTGGLFRHYTDTNATGISGALGIVYEMPSCLYDAGGDTGTVNTGAGSGSSSGGGGGGGLKYKSVSSVGGKGGNYDSVGSAGNGYGSGGGGGGATDRAGGIGASGYVEISWFE